MANRPQMIAAVLALALSWTAEPGAAAAGAIKGKVRFAGAVAESPKLKVTVDHSVCGTSKDAEDLVVAADKGLRNVVVSLVAPPPNTKWNVSTPVQMDQKQCVFAPRVIVVPAGGTVEFLNSDRLLHNLHSAGTDNPVFNRTQPKGRTIPIVFHRPETVRIDCDLHPWMRAWVVVAEHPFYAVTGEQGDFTLENVPPGRYTLRAWHETLGAATQDVTVTEAVTPVTVELGRK